MNSPRKGQKVSKELKLEDIPQNSLSLSLSPTHTHTYAHKYSLTQRHLILIIVSVQWIQTIENLLVSKKIVTILILLFVLIIRSGRCFWCTRDGHFREFF